MKRTLRLAAVLIALVLVFSAVPLKKAEAITLKTEYKFDTVDELTAKCNEILDDIKAGGITFKMLSPECYAENFQQTLFDGVESAKGWGRFGISYIDGADLRLLNYQSYSDAKVAYLAIEGNTEGMWNNGGYYDSFHTVFPTLNSFKTAYTDDWEDLMLDAAQNYVRLYVGDNSAMLAQYYGGTQGPKLMLKDGEFYYDVTVEWTYSAPSDGEIYRDNESVHLTMLVTNSQTGDELFTRSIDVTLDANYVSSPSPVNVAKANAFAQATTGSFDYEESQAMIPDVDNINTGFARLQLLVKGKENYNTDDFFSFSIPNILSVFPSLEETVQGTDMKANAVMYKGKGDVGYQDLLDWLTLTDTDGTVYLYAQQFMFAYINAIGVAPNLDEDAAIAAAKESVENYLGTGYSITITKDTYYDPTNLFVAGVIDLINKGFKTNGNSSIYGCKFVLTTPAEITVSNYMYVVSAPNAIQIPTANTTSASTGVTVSDMDGNSVIPYDMYVEAKEITSGELFESAKQIAGDSKFVLFDINVFSNTENNSTDINEQITNVGGRVLVRIPVAADFKENGAKFMYVDNEGDVTLLPDKDCYFETVGGQKYACFYTDHFSSYGVIEGTDPNPNPKTGDSSLVVMVSALITLVAAMLFVTAYNLKKRANRA